MTARIPMILTLAFVGTATGEPTIDPTTCHAYEAIAGEMTWNQAQAAAAARTFAGVPGHLATVTSAQETDFLAAAFGPRDSFALGGVQTGGPEPAGGWTWITGEPWGYTNWDTGEPNNALIHGEFESRLAWKTGIAPRWNDVAADVDEGPGLGQYRMNGYFVEYDLAGPEITQHPADVFICGGGRSARFSVTVSGGGPDSFTYHWQIQTGPSTWMTLGNDPGPLPCGGGGFAYAFPLNSAAVTIGVGGCAGITQHHVRAVIESPCGSVTSNPATLAFRVCPYGACFADYDGSGGTPDGTDIDAFFVDWLGGAECADADCSGGTPDATDIDAFFAAWLAGGC